MQTQSTFSVGGVNVKDERKRRVLEIYDKKEINSQNLDFVLKYINEHMTFTAGILKLITASENKILDILSTGIIVRPKRDEIIFTEKEPIYEIYTLVEGSVDLFKNDTKKIVTKDIILDITEVLEKSKTSVIGSKCINKGEDSIIMKFSLEKYKDSFMESDFVETKKIQNTLEEAIPYFKSIDQLNKMDQLKRFRTKDYKIGEIQFMPYDVIKTIHIIINGAVGLFTTKKLEKHDSLFTILTKYDRGYLLNENYALSNLQNPFGAMAITENVKMLLIDEKEFSELLDDASVDSLKGTLNAKMIHLNLIFNKLNIVSATRIKEIQDRYLKYNNVPLNDINGVLKNAEHQKKLRTFDQIIGSGEKALYNQSTATNIGFKTPQINSKNAALRNLDRTQMQSLNKLKTLGLGSSEKWQSDKDQSKEADQINSFQSKKNFAQLKLTLNQKTDKKEEVKQLSPSKGIQDKMKLSNTDLLGKLGVNKHIDLNNTEDSDQDSLSPLDNQPSKPNNPIFERPNALAGLCKPKSEKMDELKLLTKQIKITKSKG